MEYAAIDILRFLNAWLEYEKGKLNPNEAMIRALTLEIEEIKHWS